MLIPPTPIGPDEALRTVLDAWKSGEKQEGLES